MDLTEFGERYPDLYQAILKQGREIGKVEGFAEGRQAGLEEGREESREEGLKVGAESERERIKGIEDLAMPGHEKLVQDMKFDGQTLPAQAAIRLVQAENALRKNVVAALLADGVVPVAHVATDGAGTDNGRAVLPDGPEKWKAEYEATEDLRREFRSVENYVAYMQGIKEGRVKILGRRIER